MVGDKTDDSYMTALECVYSLKDSDMGTAVKSRRVMLSSHVGSFFISGLASPITFFLFLVCGSSVSF